MTFKRLYTFNIPQYTLCFRGFLPMIFHFYHHILAKIAIFGMSIPSWSSGQANAWLLLARCHLAAKNHDEAQMSCREAHALCEETKNFQQELEVWQQVGGRIQNFTFHEAKTQFIPTINGG